MTCLYIHKTHISSLLNGYYALTNENCTLTNENILPLTDSAVPLTVSVLTQTGSTSSLNNIPCKHKNEAQTG